VVRRVVVLAHIDRNPDAGGTRDRVDRRDAAARRAGPREVLADSTILR
jgi:hypothetical protein